LASAGPSVEDWTLASRDVIARLPVFLSFSSKAEPDPEAEVRSVLQASYQRMLEDVELVGPVRQLEGEIISRLCVEAEQLCTHIRQRVPELTSVSAIPALSFRHGFSSVQLRAFKGNEDVGLQQAGSGRQRRISLAVWEWTCLPHSDGAPDQPDIVIAYDEPDTHLDYAKQRELVDLIHAQCQAPGMRMVVATHSLNLIDRVDIADIVQLRLDEKGRTVAERLADESHDGVDRYLSQLSTAMGLRTSVLLHERCFLAVEGQTEEQTFPLLFRLAMGKPMQSAGIALISGNGNDGALKVTEFLIKHNRNVVFIVDADSATNTGCSKQFNLEKLRSNGVEDRQVHFIGAPNELEELYSDNQWSETANATWPRQDGHPWTAGDIATLRGDGKFSDKLKKLIWMNARKGPASKQEMNMKLVLRLCTPDEVPQQLREKFQAVARLAAGSGTG
jgi:Overcoming lysogenization defect protein-like, TOPRIM domain